MIDDRITLLESLLDMNFPLAEIRAKLSGLNWDSRNDLVMLTRDHVISVLRRFESGKLSAGDLEEWANLIEGREDIGFESSAKEALQDVVYELANPKIMGEISKFTVKNWLQILGSSNR